MTFNDIPLFSVLKGRLGYLAERQRLISQNVANSDTPGYSPQDLAPFQIKGMDDSGLAGGPGMTLAPVMTQPGHLPGVGAQPQPWKPSDSPDSETRLDGNRVVLEEQMMKMNESRMNYAATVDFYEKAMNMVQLAIRAPGKGS